MPYTARPIDPIERVLFAVIGALFAVVAFDSGRVPYTSSNLWVMMYLPGVFACLWYAATARLAALQLIVVFLSVPGLARAALYLIGPEHRLTPVGLNGTIGALLLLYHHVRRLDAV